MSTSALEKYGIDLRALKKNAKGYRIWPPEMRTLVVALAEQHPIRQLEDELGIPRNSIFAWRSKLNGGAPSASETAPTSGSLSSEELIAKYGFDASEVVLGTGGRRAYPVAFKERVAALSHTAAEIARDFGVGDSLVSYWKKGGRPDRSPATRAARTPHSTNGILPTKPKPRATRHAPSGLASFVCDDINSAIGILERLRGQPGKVTVIIE